MARIRRWASCLKCRGCLSRFGYDHNGCPRARCANCGTFTTSSNPLAQFVRSPRKREQAKGYLLKGESIRSTVQILGISKRTVESALDELQGIEIKCGCGDDARHQGWCRVRLARSPKRQVFLRRWGIDGSWPTIQSRPSNVPIFCVGEPDAQTAIAIERAALRAGVLGDHALPMDNYFKASNEIWKAAHRLGCRVCGTYRRYGGKRCRRCTTIQTRLRETEIVVGGSVSYPIWKTHKDFQLFAKYIAVNASLTRSQKLMALLKWKPENSQS